MTTPSDPAWLTNTQSQHYSDYTDLIGSSIAVGGAVAAPTVGATLVTTAVLPAGFYKVELLTYNAGTAETTAAGLFNINLRKGTTVVSAAPSTGQTSRMTFERISLDGTQTLNAVAIAAAIAGSMYIVSLSATLLSS